MVSSMRSSMSEDESLKTETDKSQNDEDIDDLLQLRLVPKKSFIEKVQQALKSIMANRK